MTCSSTIHGFNAVAQVHVQEYLLLTVHEVFFKAARMTQERHVHAYIMQIENERNVT